MGSDLRLFVFAYDVSDDGKRVAIARRLEANGVRVQGSVFEIRCPQARARELAESLRRHLDRGDSLRVYCVPDRALSACIAIGGAPVPEAGNYLLF